MTLVNGETPENAQVQVMVEGKGRVFFAEPDNWWTTINQMMEMCFNPELEKRKAAGSIDETFSLTAAQLYLPEEGENVVRFNDEVRGYANLKLSRPVEKGEPVTMSDFEGFERYELLAEELNGGHFTMFAMPDGFIFDFNFLRGRAKAFSLIDLSAQYMDAAEGAAAKKHVGPCLDNLFSACELLAKASCILHTLKGAESKKHAVIASSINVWGSSETLMPTSCGCLISLRTSAAAPDTPRPLPLWTYLPPQISIR